MSIFSRVGWARFAVLAVALHASNGIAQSQRFDGVTLRVGTYGGLWRDTLHATVGKRFEELGGKVEYVIGTPTENLGKIIAARGRAVPIDMIEIGPAERIAMTRNQFLEDLPAAMMSSLPKLSVKVVDKQAIAHQMVQNGIIYRTDRFEQEQLRVPTRFEDLQDPKLAQRTIFPDVVNPQHWPAVSALARGAGGSEASPDPGFAEVLKMKPLYYYAAATDLAQRISTGDVIAAPSHAGVAIRLHNAGQPVGFVHPQIGDRRGSAEYNYLAIVKGTKNAEAAAAFINIWLDTEPSAEFSKPVGAVPTNIESRKILMKDPVLNRFMLLSDEDVAKTFTMDWDKVDVEKWRSTWTRTVSR
jgi:putative spermidine/putrescine transport system substrate-binding protein